MSCKNEYYENHWTGRMNRRVENLLTSVMPQGKLFLYYADPQWSKRTSNVYGGLQLGIAFPVRLKDEAELLAEQLGNVGFQDRKKSWHFTGNKLVTRMLAAAGLEPDLDTLPHYYPRPGSAWYHAKPANLFKRTRKGVKRAAAQRQAMRKAS